LIQKSNRGEFSCTQKRIYFREYIDAKYADLPPATRGEKICTISQCLYDELVGAVGGFGAIKDSAEPIMENNKKLHKSDKLPKDLSDEAKAMYRLLGESNILEPLADEVKACK
jgi:hypothetical protein